MIIGMRGCLDDDDDDFDKVSDDLQKSIDELDNLGQSFLTKEKNLAAFTHTITKILLVDLNDLYLYGPPTNATYSVGDWEQPFEIVDGNKNTVMSGKIWYEFYNKYGQLQKYPDITTGKIKESFDLYGVGSFKGKWELIITSTARSLSNGKGIMLYKGTGGDYTALFGDIAPKYFYKGTITVETTGTMLVQLQYNGTQKVQGMAVTPLKSGSFEINFDTNNVVE